LQQKSLILFFISLQKIFKAISSKQERMFKIQLSMNQWSWQNIGNKNTAEYLFLNLSDEYKKKISWDQRTILGRQKKETPQ